MPARHEEPIVAIATASGRGAVGIVRVSAPADLGPLVRALCGEDLAPRPATHHAIRERDGPPIDRGHTSRLLRLHAALTN